MKRISFAEMNCPMARALDEVGEWWSLLIVRDILFGSRRFEELQENLGIARNILATRLQTLIDHGIVERRPYNDRPARFEYVLTRKGRDLFVVLGALRQWSQRWIPGEDETPVLRHAACGEPIAIGAACATCGEIVDSTRDLRIGDA